MKISKTNLFLIFIFGFIVRFYFSFQPGFKVDVEAWYAWALRMAELGPSLFYSPDVWTNYTPGFLYILWLLGIFQNIFNLTPEVFYVLLKMPAIMADLALSYLVYQQVNKSNLPKKWSLIVLLLMIFNPMMVFNSSIWGQIDSILTLAMFGAITLLDQKRYIASSIVYGLAILIKPQAIAIGPIYLLYLIKQRRLGLTWKLALPGISTILLLSWPFFPTNPLQGIISLVSQMTEDYPYTSLFAFNFWGSFGFWKADNIGIGPISLHLISLLMFGGYWLMLSIAYLKNKLDLWGIATLACFGFYFLPTRVHDRYLYPAMIFLMVKVASFKSKLLLINWGLITLIHFMNLYFVYIYYNYIYHQLPTDPLTNSLYGLIDTSGPMLSLVSTVIFVIISYGLLQKYAKTVKH